ncbi:hypothetical protein BV899_06105 [Alcaligenes phenolicus]|nr:hypothetical protein BV899_06105 [Alcaligenes phenolicus]
MAHDDQIPAAVTSVGGLGRKRQEQSTQSAKQPVFQGRTSRKGEIHEDESAEKTRIRTIRPALLAESANNVPA